MKFSLVIPCYNEAATLPLLIDRCSQILRPDIEIILVDNGSTDSSATVLGALLPQYPGFRSIRVEQNLGYGFGIIAGLNAAKGEILGWTHADMQTDPFDSLIGLEKFDQFGSDIFVKGRRKGRPAGDVLFTFGMSVFESLLLKKPMWDINAQPTMFSRKFYNSWSNPPQDFSIDLYAYYQARVTGLKIVRFPVIFGARAHGVSHWNVNWASKWRFIHRTIDFSIKLRKRL